MDNKKVFIGLGLLAVGTIGYFALKNKKIKNDVANAESLVIDDSDISESDINYLSSNGIKPVSIKKYLTYLKNNPSNMNSKLYNDKQIFSLFDNLNIRDEAWVNPSTKIGVVSKKYTYLGRIKGLALDENKELFFKLTPPTSNYNIKDSFNWGSGTNPFIRYVKASAVFANI